MGRRGRRTAPGGRGGGGKPSRSGNPRRSGRSSSRRALPPVVTVLGGVLLLALAVFFIFFVARGCVATQEATEVRKYVTGSNSLLTDSSNLGREKLQPILQASNGEPGQIEGEAMGQLVEQSERLYQQAEENGEVPPEFEEANNYLVSTLGVRATATRQLQRSLSGTPGASRTPSRPQSRTTGPATALPSSTTSPPRKAPWKRPGSKKTATTWKSPGLL